MAGAAIADVANPAPAACKNSRRFMVILPCLRFLACVDFFCNGAGHCAALIIAFDAFSAADWHSPQIKSGASPRINSGTGFAGKRHVFAKFGRGRARKRPRRHPAKEVQYL
jgi:hypothetical protein